MTFKSVGSGYGGTGLTDLPEAVKQLQGIKQVIVDGEAANTSISVPGLLTTSHIVSVVDLTTPAMVANATVHAGGQMRSVVNTTGKKLLVTFLETKTWFE